MTLPLDVRFGAGMVNVNNSHLILTAGRQASSPTTTVANVGWDFNTIDVNGQRRYFFDVPVGQSVVSFSAALTWHRQFQDGNAVNLTFANLNLRLFAANSDFALVGTALESSLSSVDNVEHLWRTTGMSSGRYALVVDSVDSMTAATSEYGIVWQFIPVPEPGMVGGFALMIVVVIRRFKK